MPPALGGRLFVLLNLSKQPAYRHAEGLGQGRNLDVDDGPFARLNLGNRRLAQSNALGLQSSCQFCLLDRRLSHSAGQPDPFANHVSSSHQAVIIDGNRTQNIPMGNIFCYNIEG